MSKDHMLRELKEQPRVLRETGDRVAAFLCEQPVDWGTIRCIHILGCGDMDFAARTAAWLVRAGSIDVIAHRSMDMRWLADRLRGDDLVLAASFSGRTPRTVEAAKLARMGGAWVWGITGNPESLLARSVDRVLLLETGPKDELTRHDYAGYHHNVPQTKTFTSVLLAELLLLEAAGCLDRLAARDLSGVAEAISDALPSLEAGIQCYLNEHFRAVKRFAVLGSGPWRSIAAYGAAKFMEMAVPARVQCLEENNHLEMFVTDQEDGLILLAPDQASWTRAKELLAPYSRFGALRIVLAPSSITGAQEACSIDPSGAVVITLPEGRGVCSLFTTAVALQLLTAALGRALCRDIDQWVGGVRVELIEELGQELVRRSKIQGDFPS